MKKYKQKPKKLRQEVLDKVSSLFKQAELIAKENPELANRYVKLAREMSMKVKVRIPTELKRRFCKHCHVYFIPGANYRVRTQRGKVVYYCFNCKKYMRFPYIREQKAKRKK